MTDNIPENAGAVLYELFDENARYIKENDTPSLYSGLERGQSPQVTLLTCSDSRVPQHIIKKHTEGYIFAVENIGNQIQTSEGSVDYGVWHLKTPVLGILGHTDCGAIKAAQGDYSNETPGIRRELDLLSGMLPQSSESIDRLAEANVDAQVDYALKQYQSLVDNGQLSIVGLMMDFTGTYGDTPGAVYLTNLNGKDPKSVAGIEYPVKRLN